MSELFLARAVDRLRRVVMVVLAGIALAAPAGQVAAQDWDPPGSSRISDGRFSIVAFPEDARLARSLLSAAALQDSFPGLPKLASNVVIAIAPDEQRFRAWVGNFAPEWGEAIAFPRSQRIVMRGTDAVAAGGDPRVTLRHEIAHLALYEVLGPGVPRWFDEGYASFAAGEWGRDQVLATSFGLVWRGIPSLAGLDSGFFRGSETAQRSYALAHRAVAELSALSPERGLSLLFDQWQRHGSFEQALRRAHGMSTLDFERHWRARVRRQFGALALGADLSVLAFVLLVFLGPLWWQRRARNLARMERLREADLAASERERTSALSALLGESETDPPDDHRIKGS